MTLLGKRDGDNADHLEVAEPGLLLDTNGE